MAKQVLLNFLSQHLGPFVDGLSRENLRGGIFSGNLELVNVSLKPDIFDSLNLPLRLVCGTIKSIRLNIPWAGLGKSPIVANINGVLLQVEFCDESKLSAKEMEVLTEKLRKHILDTAQRRSFSKACANLKVSAAAYRIESAKHQSFASFMHTYFQRMVTKMLFNVEAEITNVHIRYTDKASASKLIVAGITIQKLSLVSPVVNAQTSSGHSLAKVLRVENLCVYWDCQGTNFGNQDSMRFNYHKSKARLDSIDMSEPQFILEEWENGMLNTISMASTNPVKSFAKNCIICAPNLFEFSIKHQPTVTGDNPRLEITSNITLLTLTVDQMQLEQLVDVLCRVAGHQKRLKMTLFRPQRRPTVDARAWWIYAYQLVTGREDLIHKFKDRLQACLQNRDRYIDLVMKGFKVVKSSELLPHDPLETFIMAHHIPEELSEEELQEKMMIERTLPIQALIVYQNLAMEFLVRKDFTEQLRHQEEASLQKRSVAGGSSFSCFGNKKDVIQPPTKPTRTRTFMNSTTTMRGSMMRSLRNMVGRGHATSSTNSTDIPFEDFANAMENELEVSEVESRLDILLLKINLNFTVSLAVSINRNPVMEVVSTVGSCLTFFSLTRVCCTWNISDLRVEEKIANSRSRKPMIVVFYKSTEPVKEDEEVDTSAAPQHSSLGATKGKFKTFSAIGHSIGEICKEIEDETKKGVHAMSNMLSDSRSPHGNEGNTAVDGDRTLLDSSTHAKSPTNRAFFSAMWSRKEPDSPTARKQRRMLMNAIKDSRVAVGAKTTRSQRMLNAADTHKRLNMIEINYEYNTGGRSSVQITAYNVEVNFSLLFFSQLAQGFMKTAANLKQAMRSFWSGDFISQAPQCTIVTNKSNGKSVVQITDAITDMETDIFKRYFSSFTMALRNVIGDRLTMDVAIIAPKIYLDSDFASDRSFSVIDVESIALTGFISAASRNFELKTVVNELSVTCGVPLPTTANNRVSTNRKLNISDYINVDRPGCGLGYLLHPANLSATFSNTDLTSSDGSVIIDLDSCRRQSKGNNQNRNTEALSAQSVLIELDIPRSLQLMLFLEDVLDAVTCLKKAISSFPVLVAVPEANLFDHFADKIPAVHQLRKLVALQFYCPAIAVVFNYSMPGHAASTSQEAVILKVNELRAVLNQRLFDTKVLLTISTFNLEATYRPPECQIIVGSLHKADAIESVPLIQISLGFGRQKKISTAQVMFADFDGSVSVDVVQVNVDAHFIFHLNEVFVPLVQHILNRMVARESGVAATYLLPFQNVFSSTHDMQPNESSMTLLRKGGFVTGGTMRYDSYLNKDVVKLALRVKHLDVNVALVETKHNGSLAAVPVCVLHIEGVDGNANLSKGVVKKARMSLGVLELLDCRTISREFFYRKVVGMQQVKSGSRKTDFMLLDYLNQVSNDRQTSNQTLNMCLSSIQMNVCVDVIIDISSTLIGVAFALVHLISPVAQNDDYLDAARHDKFNAPQVEFRVPGVRTTSPAPMNDIKSVLSEIKRKFSNGNSNFKFKLTAAGASMLLIEDPVLQTSPSVSISYMLEVIAIQSTIRSDGQAHSVTESLSLSVSNVCLGFVLDSGRFLISGGEFDQEVGHLAVKQPISVDCSFRKEQRQGISVSAECLMNVSDVGLVLSVLNLRTAISVIGRMSLAGMSHLSQPTTNIAYCVWGSTTSPKDALAMYDFTVNTGRTTLETVSDTFEGGVRHPCLRFGVHGFSFKFDGLFHPRLFIDSVSVIMEVDFEDVEGAGSSVCSIEFFHPVAKQWESVLDPVDINLAWTEKMNEFLCSVTAPEALRLNISGAVIEAIMYQYSKLLLRGGSLVSRSSLVPLTAKPTSSKGLSLLEPYRNNAWARLFVQSSQLVRLRRNNEKQTYPRISLTNAYLAGFQAVVMWDRRIKADHNCFVQSGERILIDSPDSDVCRLCIKLPHCEVSNEVSLNTSVTTSKRQDLVISKSGREITRLVVEAWNNSSDGTGESFFEIVVFAVGALVDLTGLGLCALSPAGREMTVRATHSSQGMMTTRDKISDITAAYNNSCNSTNAMSASASTSVWATPGGKSQLIVAPQSIDDAKFGSQRLYKVSNLKLGRPVYTDRNYEWTHIPPLFLRQCYFQTACDDYGSVISNLMQFTCTLPVFVFVLLESSSAEDPVSWMNAEGYVRTNCTLVAKRRFSSHAISAGAGGASEGSSRHEGMLQQQNDERHFVAYGKFFKQGDTVVLGSAGLAGASGYMYSVSVVHTSLLNRTDTWSVDILHAVLTAPTLTTARAEECWIEGNMGLCTLHSSDGTVAVGLVDDNCWSSKLQLNSMSSDKQFVEIECAAKTENYQLAVQFTRMPGIFYRTTQVKAMPYYCILNCSDEFVDMLQCHNFENSTHVNHHDDHSKQRFHPYECGSWHKRIKGSKNSLVRLRTRASKWSYGGVDLNEIGSNVLLLALEGGQSHVCLHVDVRLAEESDACAIVIVIWKESVAAGTTISISISNETNVHLSASQAGLSPHSPNSSALSLLSLGGSDGGGSPAGPTLADFVLSIPPKSWIPFAWTDPSSITDTILLTLPLMSSSSSDTREGGSIARHRQEMQVDVLALNKVQRIDLPANGTSLFTVVQARGNGRVIRVVSSLEELGHLGPLESSQVGFSAAATGGAVAAGAIVGTLLMGPIGTVLVAGGTYVLISKVNADAKAQLDVDVASLAEERARELLTQPMQGSSQRIRTKNFDGYNSNINLTIAVSIAEVSVGLFVEKPTRRELLALYLDEVVYNLRHNALSKSNELLIKDIQLDTYSETAVSHVVLMSKKKKEPDNKPPASAVAAAMVGERARKTSGANLLEAEPPGHNNVLQSAIQDTEGHFLHALAVEEFHPEEDTVHFKYIGLRMLELGITIDSATLQLLVIDLGVDFSYLSTEQEAAMYDPVNWSASHSARTLATNSGGLSLLADVRGSQHVSQAKRILIENLVIHPMKFTVTFAQTSLPRKKDQIPREMLSVGLLSLLPSFAALDNATIHLESFIVCNVMETLPSLMSRVSTTKWRELQYQLAALAGSLTVIGSPIGLLKKIGGGVSGLVYEPYQGAVRSPRGFVAGIGRGASGFVSGILSGALNSSAGIVSTASQGISQSMVTLSGSDEFAQGRIEARKRAQDAAREGVWAGLAEGGGSILQGFSSGLTGLVAMPLAGLSQSTDTKSGLTGLVTGFGLGVVNAGVRPLLGVSDGLNSVAQTVMTGLNTGTLSLPYRRSPRALVPVSVPIDDEAAVDGMAVVATAEDGALEVNLILAVRKPLSRKSTGQNLVGMHDAAERTVFPIICDLGNGSTAVLTKKYLRVTTQAPAPDDEEVEVDEKKMWAPSAAGGHRLVQVSTTTLRDSSLEQVDCGGILLRWKDVSHFAFASNMMAIHVNTCNENKVGVDISCENRKRCVELAKALLLCASFMKNPLSNPDASAISAIHSPVYSLSQHMPSFFTDHERNYSSATGASSALPTSFAYPSNSMLYITSNSNSRTLQSSNNYSLSARSIRVNDEKVIEQQRPRNAGAGSGLGRGSSGIGFINGGEVGIGGGTSRNLVDNNRGSGLADRRDSKASSVSTFELGGGQQISVEAYPARSFPFGSANKQRGSSGTASYLFPEQLNRNAEKALGDDLFQTVGQELALVNLLTQESVNMSTGLVQRVSCSYDAWQRLDEIMWQVVREWTTQGGYKGRGRGRCSICGVINETNNGGAPIALQTELCSSAGGGVHILGGPGYNKTWSTIAPGGMALVFLWAEPVGLGCDGHAKANVHCGGHTFSLSTKRLKLRPSSNSTTNYPRVTFAGNNNGSTPNFNKSKRNIGINNNDEKEGDNLAGAENQHDVEILETSMDVAPPGVPNWCKFVVKIAAAVNNGNK